MPPCPLLIHPRLGNAEQHGEKSKIRGIQLPGTNLTQLILQFANDTSFTLEANNNNHITNMVSTLNLFNRVFGLEINWAKSLAYWHSLSPRPQWLDHYNWQWAEE
jgi:hypothetical protein